MKICTLDEHFAFGLVPRANADMARENTIPKVVENNSKAKALFYLNEIVIACKSMAKHAFL